MQKTFHTTVNKEHLFTIVLIAENIRTPENLGMIMRISEAFAVEKIYFAGSAHTELTTKAKRTSRNTFKTMQYEFCEDGQSPLTLLKQSGYSTLALEITENSVGINTFRTEKNKFALVVGSERRGVSAQLLDLCDHHLHISMFGDNSSLNVVNALSIALYEITK